MADLALLALIIGFFGVMVLLVRGCDRIVGPDLPIAPVGEESVAIDGSAAAAAATGTGAGGRS
jgi:hypothetical protein